ncbi:MULTISPECIES: hypothetical protein [Pseudothermotoga]|jgi:hypothetical protein|uniref:Uncharacterized protein n=1 Tax=Pseudothermotoga lettingae (strain ATCC BAA-301 / DSM 14385 / NBRC 107922 / TMO) TaxID=416591 RepID=A8F6R4_PSELT|nr:MULTISPECIES: hypothetical protein [Pseudothermotoga]ABV33848.1 hypothetical protein Tlet_1290 [Pseudothermotoga lettingae TMO]KUK20913.1 MAG: Uncharacterized protein XD56_1162 [Pseudothermotoga lettingae]MDK2884324.1 hypothetical protein [Pseudothermotoga sp.]GLI49216.1 hypothetical protein PLETTINGATMO_13850 [Pseudothermotoga lettingae TMO]
MEYTESDKKKLAKKVKEGYELVEIVFDKKSRYAILQKNEQYVAVKLSKAKEK